MNSRTAMKSFEKLFGCHVSLHDYYGLLSMKCGLKNYCNHKNSFCNYVKTISSRHLRDCIVIDAEIIKEKAAVKEKAFLKICHAGVAEICAPVFYKERLSGMLFTGPFHPDKNCFTLKNILLQEQMNSRKLESFAAAQFRKLYKTDLPELMNFTILLASYLERSLGTDEDNMKTLSPAEKIESFFDNKFSDKNINLEMLASFMALSSSRISQLLRKLFKKSFSDMLNEKRMGHARYMLRESFLGTVAVSESCGYSDSAYFFRVFKTLNNGITPKQYRKAHSAFRPDDI